MVTVDLNCDLGESFGTYTLGNDAEILSCVTSANIACGFHAGDASTMRKTVKLALNKGVSIGAHPGLQDLLGFGRRRMEITPQEAYDIVVYQIGALWAFVHAEGGSLQHVKPHGELYQMAAIRAGWAEAIAEAVYKVNPELILYGLAGSELIRAGQQKGLRTANEVFADRTYQADGSLTSRVLPDALITDGQVAVRQVIRMVREGMVRTQQGVDIPIAVDTICIHGDQPQAAVFAATIKQALSEDGIRLQSLESRR